MKNLILVTILTILLIIAIAQPALADYKVEVGIPGDNTGPGDKVKLGDYLGNLFIFLIAVAGLAGMFFIIYGGFIYMMSGSNASKVTDAKDRIIAAISGLILVICSVVLLTFINPDLAFPKLPGMSEITAEDSDLSSFLPGAGNPGKGKHDISHGYVAENPEDCEYSHGLQEWFICLANPNKGPYPSQTECGADLQDGGTDCPVGGCAGTFVDAGDIGKEPQKYCTRLFDPQDPDGKIGNEIAYGYGCLPTDECYDDEAICHRSFGPTCRMKSGYWRPCTRQEECKEDLICKIEEGENEGRCSTEDDVPPEEPGDGEAKDSISGDQKIFISKDGNLSMFAFDYKWSGTNKCGGKFKKITSVRRNNVCQMRWPPKPTQTTEEEIIKCDEKEKCTAYRWGGIVNEASGATKDCKSSYDWEKEGEGNGSKCKELGLEGGPIRDNHQCCKYEIICCEEKDATDLHGTDGKFCNKLTIPKEEQDEFEWKKADTKDCFNDMEDKFNQETWIVQWRKSLSWGTSDTHLPAACCEKVKKEGIVN